MKIDRFVGTGITKNSARRFMYLRSISGTNLRRIQQRSKQKHPIDEEASKLNTAGQIQPSSSGSERLILIKIQSPKPFSSKTHHVKNETLDTIKNGNNSISIVENKVIAVLNYLQNLITILFIHLLMIQI